MKRKLILCAFILTTLVLGGCSRNNTNNSGNSSTSDSGTQSSTTESSQINESSDTNTATNNSGNTNVNSTEHGTMISESQAKEIALAHAGLTAEQVTFVKSGIDRDNGKVHYDVEFYTSDQLEYDYEIDGYSGEIVEWDVEEMYR